jgi:aminoglycoside phosphotransferase (APT) family kinase protein
MAVFMPWTLESWQSASALGAADRVLPLRRKRGSLRGTLRTLATELPDSAHCNALLTRVFGAAAARARLESPIDGAINRTFPVTLDDTRYALRLRVNEAGFRYEKGIAKSALVGAIHAAKIAGASDHEAAGAKPNGKAPPHAPTLHHWSDGDDLWPLPWEIATWCPGDAIGAAHARPSNAALMRAGHAIAEIHGVTFDGGTSDLLTLDRPKQDFASWVGGAIDRELARGPVPGTIDGYARAIARKAPQAARWTMVHNDLHGLHLIDDPAAARIWIIDWDNALVAPPELDFVKLKHWTRIDPATGHLSADPAMYAAILSAYEAKTGRILDLDVFAACEALWLLRVWRFESERREQGRPTPLLFAGPEIYRAALDRLVAAA